MLLDAVEGTFQCTTTYAFFGHFMHSVTDSKTVTLYALPALSSFPFPLPA
jgi:hypothetical protein